MKAEAAFAALREANPVPDAARFEQTLSSSAAFLQATIERSEHMTKTVKNKQQTRVEPEATRRDPVGLPPRRQGARRPLVAIAAVVVVLAIGAAAAILTLSGDGGNDVVTSPTRTEAVSAPQPGPITSLENIAGTTYERQGPGPKRYLLFFEDGTFHQSSNRDLIVDSPQQITEIRVEDTTVFVNETKGSCGGADATYEIHLLENGNLKLVEIEDACDQRSSMMTLNTEWVPVP